VMKPKDQPFMKLVTMSFHRTCYIRSTIHEAEKPPGFTDF